MRSRRASLILTAVPLILLGAACSTDDDAEGSSATDSVVVDDSAAVDDSVVVDDTVTVGTATNDAATGDTTGDTTGDDTTDDTSDTDDSVSGSDDGTATTDIRDRLETAREALSDRDFSTMLQALNLSSIADEIEGRAVTILAPTNDAFTSMSASELRGPRANPTEIDDVLKRHIIDEALTFDELSARDSVTTLSGDTLTVTTSGSTVTVDGAVVTPPTDDRVSGEEGEEIVVFRIDRVLLPS
jgi:uncharacterized surface protein with fasciclin (FAS1) repeats